MSEPSKDPTGARPGAWAEVKEFVIERYLTLDRRVLGVFRILFGVLLLADVLRRIPRATFFYSNDGCLANHYALYAPFVRPNLSLFFTFSTPGEVHVALWATALVFAAFAVGYRTRAAQILSCVLYVSLNNRNWLVHNRGTDLVGILSLWAAFMPLGDRFSVDAVLAGMRVRRGASAEMLNDRARFPAPAAAHVSLAALAIVFQIAVIYAFSALSKTGPTWTHGDAVHLTLWQNRINTPIAAWLRMHEPRWLSPVLSKQTLWIEGIAPLLVLSPFAQRTLRTANFLLTTALHGGIALLMSIGPFSYAMFTLNFLLLPAGAADRAAKTLAATTRGRVVVFSEGHPRAQSIARLLSVLDVFERIRFLAEGSLDAPEGVPLGAALATWEPEAREWKKGFRAAAAAAAALPAGALWRLVVGLFATPGDAWLNAREEGAPRGPASRPDAPRRASLLAREGALAVLMVISGLDASSFGSIPPSVRIHESDALQAAVRYTSMNQKWGMFAPDAPRTDGLVVVDGVTVDGRHLDPFTGGLPDLDAPLHGPWPMGSLLCDYFSRMSGPNDHQAALKKYLTRWQELEGRPAADKLVSFTVYWVNSDSPPRGAASPRNISRKFLFDSQTEVFKTALASPAP